MDFVPHPSPLRQATLQAAVFLAIVALLPWGTSAAPPPPTYILDLRTDGGLVGQPFEIKTAVATSGQAEPLEPRVILSGLRLVGSGEMERANGGSMATWHWRVVADRPAFWSFDARLFDTSVNAERKGHIAGFSGIREIATQASISSTPIVVHLGVAAINGPATGALAVSLPDREWTRYATSTLKVMGDTYTDWERDSSGAASATRQVMFPVADTRGSPGRQTVYITFEVSPQTTTCGRPASPVALTFETHAPFDVVSVSCPQMRESLGLAPAGEAKTVAMEWPGTLALIVVVLASPSLLLLRHRRR